MTEFEKYIKSDFGVNSTSLYDYKNSMTPMVIEEREMRAVSMSVFDRLMMERIIWCAGPVNDRMSIVVQAQLMFLDSISGDDITIHIDTPGADGNIQDARISMEEWEKTNDILFDLLGGYCGKTPKQVMKDATRDNWLTAKESLEYGIIDEVIGLK